MPSSAARARGFTLIEVLVALLIVAVSMTAAIQVVTQRTADGTYLRDKTLAHWIAMNVVTERRLEQGAPKIGKLSDGVEFAGRQWRWTLDVQETAVETMRRLDVKVRLADAPEDSALATVTGFYGTALSPPGITTLSWDAAGPGTDGDLAPDDGTPADDEPPADDPPNDDGSAEVPDDPPSDEPPGTTE